MALAAGALSVAFSVCDATLFVSVVPPGRYVVAGSLVYGSRAMSFVGGPTAGGLLVQLLSVPFAVAADAVSFVASALFLTRVRAKEPDTERLARGGTGSGLRFLLGSATIRAVLAATTTINFFNFMFAALFVLYATRSLHVRPGPLGLVLGAGAVGGVLGSAVTSRLTRWIGVGWSLVASA